MERKEDMAFDEECEENDTDRALCEIAIEAGFAVAGISVSGPVFVAVRGTLAANAASKGSRLAKVVGNADNMVQVYREKVPTWARALGAVVAVGIERLVSLPDTICSGLLGEE